MLTDRVASRWDAEYRRGRYADEAPVAMTASIVHHARRIGLTSGLYIGCGNGRNFVPLRQSGLDLVGLDVSAEALDALRRRLPNLPDDRLVHGTIDHLPADRQYPLVIGIQVFQHGTRAQCHEHLRAAAARTAPGGLFCLRVNAIGTDLYPAHDITETGSDGGLTIRYRAGAKAGLDVHFFSRSEIESLVPDHFEPVAELTRVSERRTPPPPRAPHTTGARQLVPMGSHLAQPPGVGPPRTSR
jgi:SAM-dependent methyltransferase